MLLQGVFVPLSCPFYRDGSSYVRKLEHNIARYSLSPVAGLIVLPPGGEALGLTDGEAEASLQAAGQTAAKEKVLIAGIERTSVEAVLALAKKAEEAKFDAILLAPPPDWARLVQGMDARELLIFYESVADRSPLPVVLWSDPRPPYLPLPGELVASMAHHPNVIGMVDAGLDVGRLEEIRTATSEMRREVTVTTIFEAVTRRMQQPEQVQGGSNFVALETLSGGEAVALAQMAPTALAAPPLKTRKRTVGFQVLTASSAHAMLPLLLTGASGAAPVAAACVPQACFEVYAAWKDGDSALAEERAARLQALDGMLETFGPAAVKAACDFNGYFGGQPRLPRLPLTAAHREALERTLALTRN